MANRYSRIFHHISTQDLKRNQKEELRLRKIEDNKVLIEEEKKEVIRKELATKGKGRRESIYSRKNE